MVFDELHAQKTRQLWDVMETALGARRQPLTWAITTAGKPGESIYQDQHAYAEKVLEGVIEDDTFFPYVAQLDPADDWEDERVWIKANPNLGISVKLDNLRELAHKAKNQPSALNAFLRLRLNRPAGDFARWIPIDKWNKCVGYDMTGLDAKSLLDKILPTLERRRCVAAVDLSSKIDLTAYLKLFPPIEKDPRWILIPRFFMPEENIEKRVKEDRVPYDVWIREGFITKTAGNVVDYDVIKPEILADAKRYELLELAFDPWNATQIGLQLQKEGLTVSEFRQGFASMSEPTKQFLALILSGKLAHLGNPVLKWMASNVVVKIDEAGNEKPNKRKSAERIDGIVAAIMALGRAMYQPEGPPRSIYETQGVMVL